MIVNETFILNLQSAPNVEEQWQLFLEELDAVNPIENGRLVYKGGIFLEQVDTDKPDVAKDIDHFNFRGTTKEFQFRHSSRELKADRQTDNYFIQVDIRFANDIPKTIKPKHLEILAQIFVNQVLLQLRIDNFEFHAVKDDITQAYNQKHLRTFLRNEIERCKRYPSTFAVVFLDLDNLKAVNDVHGHLVGTEVLQEVAAILRGQIRKIDFLSRFGGDEFVIILLNADSNLASEICSRVKKKIDDTLFLKQKGLNIKMTGSFGISSFPGDGDSVETLIKKADTAMYSVKRQGKNGIKIYEGD